MGGKHEGVHNATDDAHDHDHPDERFVEAVSDVSHDTSAKQKKYLSPRMPIMLKWRPANFIYIPSVGP